MSGLPAVADSRFWSRLVDSDAQYNELLSGHAAAKWSAPLFNWARMLPAERIRPPCWRRLWIRSRRSDSLIGQSRLRMTYFCHIPSLP